MYCCYFCKRNKGIRGDEDDDKSDIYWEQFDFRCNNP